MKIKLNREYFLRHFFVAVLLLGLGGYFGYDGLLGYPSQSAHDLFVSIEKSEPKESVDLEAFKAQKIRTQYFFALAALIAGAMVAIDLASVAKFSLAYDENGFEYDGRRYRYDDVLGIDDSLWTKKTIAKVLLKDDRVMKLDGWHHSGIKEFLAKLPKPEKKSEAAS